MRAIGYFQTEIELDSSLPEMERAFREFCQLNLHQPVMTYASAGRGQVRDDPEYLRMVEYMRDSVSEFLIVVPNARHLGSDLESVARSLVKLDAIGARVSCYDEEFPDPMQNAFQTLGIKGVSRTRSRRIKESMRARAMQGQALGKPLYGYRIGSTGTLQLVREEASVVELIYRLYTQEGLGLRLIAQHLNERGIPTRRGGRWNVVSIRDILRNPSYTGTYTRLGMRRPRAHEAIIPPEVFRAAQDQTRARRPVGRVVTAEPFLLSGVLTCGYCGNKMMGVTRRQSWKRKNGQRASQTYRYYQCQSKNNQSTCGYHTWRASLLEGTVLSQLKLALPVKGSRANVETDGDALRFDEVRAMMEARARNAERRFIRVAKRVARGDAGFRALVPYLRGLEAARRGVSGRACPTEVEATMAGWETLDFEVRQVFLAEHVARITVKDNEVEIEV